MTRFNSQLVTPNCFVVARLATVVELAQQIFARRVKPLDSRVNRRSHEFDTRVERILQSFFGVNAVFREGAKLRFVGKKRKICHNESPALNENFSGVENGTVLANFSATVDGVNRTA